MELIGKQIAIETILGQPPELHYPSWYASQIEKLPPAPPEYLAEQAGILVTDSDTISRQMAIEALKNDMASLDHIIKGMSANDVRLDAYVSQRNQVNYDIYTINNLPPAQPEIVRCKDCKYWNSGSCEYPEHAVNCQDYWVGNIETEAEHFCGYAKRREVTA